MPPRERTAARNATVAPATYDAPEGWEVGNAAPADRYRELNPDGSYTDAKPTDKAPAGKYARQVAAKGDIVTEAIRTDLGLNDDAADDADSGDKA
jgi:hypothetical protein